MKPALLESAEQLLPSACAELLGAIGYNAVPHAKHDLKTVHERPDHHAAGLIDFKGPSMNGKLVVLSSFDFFAASRPASGRRAALSTESAADWLLVRDWSMELSNQLLGRLKNKLCPIGVVVDAQVPKAVSGHSLRVTVRDRKGPYRAFNARGHDVFVWFEAKLADPVVSAPSAEPIPEGQIVYF